jgi:hypothetical protein
MKFERPPSPKDAPADCALSLWEENQQPGGDDLLVFLVDSHGKVTFGPASEGFFFDAKAYLESSGKLDDPDAWLTVRESGGASLISVRLTGEGELFFGPAFRAQDHGLSVQFWKAMAELATEQDRRRIRKRR